MTFASLRCALLFAVAGVVASTAGRSLRQSVEIDGSSVIDQDTFPFLQAPLNYSFDALEPSIDAPTMFIHFTRHHRGQVNGLNSALERYPDLDGMILDDLMALVGTSRIPADIASAMRNSGGGHWNHRFFWQVMGAGIDPEVGPDAPQLREGPLYDAIIASFGSVDELRTQFTDTAASQFGSGWGWLCLKKESSGGEVQAKLITTSTPNQDNPLMALSDEPCTPLLGVDVWEHAYYLEYQNRRRTYLEAFWDVVNWAFVEKVYNAAMG